MNSSLTRHEIVYWFTTPAELRRIADAMEEFWKTCAPGHDKTVEKVFSDDATLHILVDQDRITGPGWYETLQAKKLGKP